MNTLRKYWAEILLTIAIGAYIAVMASLVTGSAMP